MVFCPKGCTIWRHKSDVKQCQTCHARCDDAECFTSYVFPPKWSMQRFGLDSVLASSWRNAEEGRGNGEISSVYGSAYMRLLSERLASIDDSFALDSPLMSAVRLGFDFVPVTDDKGNGKSIGVIVMRSWDTSPELLSRVDSELPIAILDGQPSAEVLQALTRVIASFFNTKWCRRCHSAGCGCTEGLIDVPICFFDALLRLEGGRGPKGGGGIPPCIPQECADQLSRGGCLRVKVRLTWPCRFVVMYFYQDAWSCTRSPSYKTNEACCHCCHTAFRRLVWCSTPLSRMAPLYATC